MPIPVLLFLAGGAVAAAARGASWFAERKVKQTNEEIAQAELAAYRKNDEFRAQRQHWKQEFEARLAVASDSYTRFRIAHSLDEKKIESWQPDAWLLARIGDLTIKRPLLIEPTFDMPADMRQMQAFRLYQSGVNMARNHPQLGNAMQGVAIVGAAGSYVSQQVDIVSQADKYVASATVYIAALKSTIAGYATRFQSEVAGDLQSAERLATLLAELEQSLRGDAMLKSTAIVYRSLIGLLRGLAGRYI